MKQIAYSMFSILVVTLFYVAGTIDGKKDSQSRITELTDLHQRCLDGMDSLRHQGKVMEWNHKHGRKK